MPERPRRVLVAGAGLAGLAAACAALEAGADVELLEATDGPGGATIESAGWIWRYVDLASFRRHAPGGDAAVQQLVVDRLDDDLAWLAGLGVVPVATGTGRALTRGVRVDPVQLVARLVGVVGADRIRLGTRLGGLEDAAADAVVLAGGGYAGDPRRIAREAELHETVVDAWVRRPRVANDGSTLDAGLGLGARRTVRDGQCLVRLAAIGVTDRSLAAAISELHVPGARLLLEDGTELHRDPEDWSGAHQLRGFQLTGATGLLELDRHLLDAEVHAGRIGEVVAAAARAGARIDGTSDGVRMAVQPGITHTWCGLDVDADARVALDRPAPIDLYAAGCDAAGTGLGGTASGLAQALVLGRRAGTVAARG